MKTAALLLTSGVLVGATAAYLIRSTPPPPLPPQVSYGSFYPGEWAVSAGRVGLTGQYDRGVGLKPGEPVTPYGCLPSSPCVIPIQAELLAGGCKFYQPKIVLVPKTVTSVEWTIMQATDPASQANAALFYFRPASSPASGPPERPGYGVMLYDVVDYAASSSSTPAVWTMTASAASSATWTYDDSTIKNKPKATAYEVYAQYQLTGSAKFVYCRAYDPIIINTGD